MSLLPHTLLGRLALIQVISSIVQVLLVALVAGDTHERYHLESSQRQSMRWAAEIIARSPNSFSAAPQEEHRLQPILRNLEQSNPGARFFVLAGDGKVLDATQAVDSLPRKQIDMRPVNQLLRGEASLPLLVQNPADDTKLNIFSAASIQVPNSAETVFLMVMDTPEPSSFFAIHENFLLGDSFLLALAIITPPLIASTILLFLILHPIRKLSAAIEKGDTASWKSPIRISNSSDLDALGQHFEGMLLRISELLQQKDEAERRRKLELADLSHDLRSPLSAIVGCLETMQAQPSHLSGPAAHKILDTARAQCRTLQQRIDSMFELTTLQAPDYQLHMEIFPIGEMLHEAVERFGPLAHQHNRSLCLEMSDEAHSWRIQADPFLMERVLDNLIDNAIRHAAGASSIVASAHQHEDSLEITIRDDGQPPPPTFLALHCQQSAVGAGNGHRKSARGLRIVKRILELHGSSLILRIEKPTGTYLSFRIPLVEKARGGQGQPDKNVIIMTSH